MKRATVVGRNDDQAALLDALQALGCLHVVPLTEGGPPASPPDAPDATLRAMRILASSHRRRRVARHLHAETDAEAVAAQVIAVQERIEQLTFTRDHLQKRIEDFGPWGEFAFPPLEELGGHRLWFYEVPSYQLRLLPADTVPWEIVSQDHRVAHVVAVSPEEPVGMPVPRVHLGAKPLSVLVRELEEAELALEDAITEREVLTRYRLLLARHRARARDAADRAQVTQLALRDPALFALQGWVPEPRLDALRALAQERGIALLVQEAAPDDEPPVLLQNPEPLAGGQEVVGFYSLPGYRTVDPSVPLFFSLSAFFAMIVSDAGYGLVLALLLAFAWRPLRRSSQGARLAWLGLGIVVSTVVYGLLVGSWFGLPSPAPVDRLTVLDLGDNTTMMALSVGIGVGHVVLANVLAASSRAGSPRAWAPVGWVMVIVAATLGALSAAGVAHLPASGLLGGAGLGLALIVWCSGADRWWPASVGELAGRLLTGVGALAGVVQAFGDVLSYLRLFALGLASASLAMTFNQLASDVSTAVPGLGLAIGLAVLVVGHAVNLLLAVLGGVVHGLRLNVLEFQNWCVPEDGRPFRAFRRTEEEEWNPS